MAERGHGEEDGGAQGADEAGPEVARALARRPAEVAERALPEAGGCGVHFGGLRVVVSSMVRLSVWCRFGALDTRLVLTLWVRLELGGWWKRVGVEGVVRTCAVNWRQQHTGGASKSSSSSSSSELGARSLLVRGSRCGETAGNLEVHA